MSVIRRLIYMPLKTLFTEKRYSCVLIVDSRGMSLLREVWTDRILQSGWKANSTKSKAVNIFRRELVILLSGVHLSIPLALNISCIDITFYEDGLKGRYPFKGTQSRYA
jgi:hypothetical protein